MKVSAFNSINLSKTQNIALRSNYVTFRNNGKQDTFEHNAQIENTDIPMGAACTFITDFFNLAKEPLVRENKIFNQASNLSKKLQGKENEYPTDNRLAIDKPILSEGTNFVKNIQDESEKIFKEIKRTIFYTSVENYKKMFDNNNDDIISFNYKKSDGTVLECSYDKNSYELKMFDREHAICMVGPILGIQKKYFYFEGVKTDENNNIIKADKIFHFNQDKLEEYYEGFDTTSLENIKFQKSIEFKNEGQYIYKSGRKMDTNNDNETFKECLSYKDGKLSSYSTGGEIKTDGSKKYREYLSFNNGEPYAYAKYIETLPDGSEKSQNYLFFKDDKPYAYAEDIKINPDGSKKYQYFLSFENGALKSCNKDIEIDANGKIIKQTPINNELDESELEDLQSKLLLRVFPTDKEE